MSIIKRSTNICIACLVILVIVLLFHYHCRPLFEQFIPLNSYSECLDIMTTFTRDPNLQLSEDPNAPNYWLKSPSPSERRFRDSLQQQLDAAEKEGQTQLVQEVNQLLVELNSMRTQLRKDGWALLEGSRKKDGNNYTQISNACTFKPHTSQLFETSFGECKLVNEADRKKYSNELLLPVKPNNIFSLNGKDTCYIQLPLDSSANNSDLFDAVSDILEHVGEKVNEKIMMDIRKAQNAILQALSDINTLQTVAIPNNNKQLSASEAKFREQEDQLKKLDLENSKIYSNIDSLNKQVAALLPELDTVVEVYEHCDRFTGRRAILKAGETLFVGPNEHFKGASAIKFNEKKLSVILTRDDGFQTFLPKSVSCLTEVGFNDRVVSIKVIPNNTKVPSKGVITSMANRNLALHATPGVIGQFENENGLRLVKARPKMGSDNRQKWTYDPQSKRVISEDKPYNQNWCLDPMYGRAEKNTKMIYYPCHGGDNMKFTFNEKNQLINERNQGPRCIEVSKDQENVGRWVGSRWNRRWEPNRTVTQHNVFVNDCNENNIYQRWTVENP